MVNRFSDGVDFILSPFSASAPQVEPGSPLAPKQKRLRKVGLKDD